MVFPVVGFPNPPVESPPKELAEDAKVKAKELSKHSSRCRIATGWGLLQRRDMAVTELPSIWSFPRKNGDL